ncbi:MAG TPA: hypothetical protein VMM38_10420 [Aridibacter sp.]|nr:hypothetical protein [Aridibacter sp.]
MSDPIHETEDAFVKNLRLHSDNPTLVSLTEEVREHKQKPKTDPASIPQKFSLGEFNTAMMHFYRGGLVWTRLWIFVLLALSWTLKVYLHPYPTPNLDGFL